MRRSLLTVLASLVVLVAAPGAGAAPGLLVGLSDDGLLWNTGPTAAAARDLGIGAFRVTLGWRPGRTAPTADDAVALGRAVGTGMRVVVAAYNQDSPPADDTQRRAYCTFLGTVITRFPAINDVIVWNEPNLSGFWRPQFGSGDADGAPARYEALLAHCWDVLHGLRPNVNVIGPATSLWGNDNPNAFSNVSHSPTTFIRGMGAAYRASGRTLPLFDTVGHHPYPARSDERPWSVHSDEMVISLGDIDRLLGVLREAFGGTAQRLPEDGVPIWYLETGYQTLVDPSKSQLYFGDENWPGALPDLVTPAPPPVRPPDASPAPDQATQLVDELRMTYCQRYVGANFNFLVKDEQYLGGWQSGLLWADGTRKRSYDPVRAAIADVNAGRVDCSLMSGAPQVPVTSAAATASTASTGAAVKSPARQRSITKVTYKGGRRAPFGFLRLRARLTRGVTESKAALSRRQLLFVTGNAAYLTTTDRSGGAEVVPAPPLPVGRHRVAIRFQGDELDLGSGLRVRIAVVNSRGSVRTVGRLRFPKGVTGTLSARSSGRAVQGTLVLRGPGPLRRASIRSFGLRRDGRIAWLGGVDQLHDHYVVELRRTGPSATRMRIWRNSEPLGPGITVPSSRLVLAAR